MPTEWVTDNEVTYMTQVYDTARTEGIIKDYYLTSPVVGYYDVKYVSWTYKHMLGDSITESMVCYQTQHRL